MSDFSQQETWGPVVKFETMCHKKNQASESHPLPFTFQKKWRAFCKRELYAYHLFTIKTIFAQNSSNISRCCMNERHIMGTCSPRSLLWRCLSMYSLGIARYCGTNYPLPDVDLVRTGTTNLVPQDWYRLPCQVPRDNTISYGIMAGYPLYFGGTSAANKRCWAIIQ